MASIQQRKRKAGTVYRAMWRDPDGQQKSLTFKTRKEAERFLRGLEADLDRGKYQDPQAGSVALQEWSERVVAGLQIKPKTREGYESLLRNHIAPALGHKQLRSIRRVDVQEFVSGLTLSPARTMQAYRLLSKVLNEAVANDLLVKNPCKGVSLPKVQQKQVAPLTIDRLQDLADECGHYRLFVLWLGIMGTRFSETTALTYQQFDNGTVIIDRSDDGGDGTTKSHAVRRLPVPQFLRHQIGNGQGRVFVAPRGGKISNQNFITRTFKPACERIGIDISPHDLRHTCASLLISQGASIKLVQKYLGHADAAMTLNVYGHLFPNDLEEVTGKMQKLLADSQAIRAPSI